MKIGILSDIHGHLVELNKALAHFAREQVDRIVCAGDLVDFGTWNDEVVAQIAALNIPCVQGNHDRLAESRQTLRQQKSLRDQSVKLLERQTLEFLARLPLKLRLAWAGRNILLTHANPWGNDIYIYPTSAPAMFRRVATTSDADITILGHTHEPMWIDVNGRLILNPGSVAANYHLSFGTCGILSLPEYLFRVLNVETGDDVPLNTQIIS